jgi:DNA-binding NarL/FixJ family response regulator
MCDGAGMLLDSSGGFARLLRVEWPRWSGTVVPPALVAALGNGPFAGRRIDVDIEAVGDEWLLRPHSAGAGRSLGRRERQVVRMYAAGKDYREIAREIGTSPSTVRNQLRSGFRKLGVSSKLDLARRLDEAGLG